MPASESLPDQSGYFVTVGTDQRGGACWVVVAGRLRIECAAGDCALAVLSSLLKNRHPNGPHPRQRQ